MGPIKNCDWLRNEYHSAWDYIPDMYREDEYTQTYVLNVTSQTWLSDDIMDRSEWWHYAVLVVPRETRIPDAALALIVGWNNKASNDPAGVLDRSGMFGSLSILARRDIT